MTDFSKIKSLPSGGHVMLRGSRKKLARFAPKSLSLALASAFSSASVSISHAITGLSITLAGLSSVQAQNTNLPQGGVAVHGGATFQQNGTTLNVNTTNGAGNRSIINWQSFNIGAGYTTNINQPNAQSSSLNRVVTNTPSQIYGTLRSNGQVILVNQSGIAVGAGGVVDTAGFTASTLRISDEDYKAKRLRFEGNALSGGVLIEGEDRSDPKNIRPGAVVRSRNGDVMLFAPNVSVGKDAKVQADNGNVIVGAGQSVEVTGRGLEGVKFIIQGADNKAINLGTLQGNAVGVFAGTLRHSGVIQAQSATMEGGRVVLRAIKDIEIVRDPSLAHAPKIIADGGVNAQGVAQSGGNIQIQSTQGNVTIGAGSSITANSGNSGQNQPVAGTNAAGGAINIEALQRKVVSEAGSHISATGHPGGTIRIYGGQEARIASVINASSPSLGAADAAGTLQLISAANIGGTIQILSPSTVALTTGAQLLATGDAGGGTILVGGDYQGANAEIVNAQNTNVSSGVLLEANARGNGNGGKVIVWADNDTHFSGTLHAKGGEQGGDGGFGETSGKKNLYFRGRADLSARRGRMGTLLLDPDEITIQGDSSVGTATGGYTIVYGSTGNFTVMESDLEAVTGNVLLEANRYIEFQGTFKDNNLLVAGDLTLRTRNNDTDAISGSQGIYLSGAGAITIQAGGNITMQAGTGYNAGAQIPAITSLAGHLIKAGTGNIVMESVGNISLSAGTTLSATNGDVILNSKLGNVSLSFSAGAPAEIKAKTITLQSQAADGLVDIQGNLTKLEATGTGTAITLKADRLNMDSTATVIASGGSITIRPNDDTRTIRLGGGTDSSGTGALQISQDEYDNLSVTTGNAIRFGDASSYKGNIVLGADTNIALGTKTVAVLTTGTGSITSDAGKSVTSQNLRLQASSIALNGNSNNFFNLAAKSTGGAINITTGGSNTFITTVDGLSGIESFSTLNLSNNSLGLTNLYLNSGNINTEGNITLLNFDVLGVYNGTFTIDSNKDNLGNSGSIQIDPSKTTIQGNSASALIINSSAPAGTAGAISFGSVQIDTVSNALGGLTVNSSGTTAGQITLPNTINVGAGGATITGQVMLTQAVNVEAQGSGAITFNGEIQGGFALGLTSDTGDITLNAIAGNGTKVGTIDIFSNEGTVNLNKNITTSAGTNVNVVAANVNVANNAEIYADGLLYLGATGTAAANTISAGTGSVLFARTGLVTLSAEDNITLNGQVSGYSDIDVNSSAGVVIMGSSATVYGFDTSGSAGTKSLSIHGQAGVTLGALAGASTLGISTYNATVTTGAGQTIATANAGLTSLAGFYTATLGSAGARSNIGFGTGRIELSNAGNTTVFAGTNLHLLSRVGGETLNLAAASVDTGVSSTANMTVISNGSLNLGNVSVLGTGTAIMALSASNTLSVGASIAGTSSSELKLLADEAIDLGATAGAIGTFKSVSLLGRTSGQHIRFVDTLGAPVANTVFLTYGKQNAIAGTVDHVVVGDASAGNIEFQGASNFTPPTASSARDYTFLSGGSIASSANRLMDLNEVGFSAAGNVNLSNVTLSNSTSGLGMTIAARSGAAINLTTNDAQGVTINSVGTGAYQVDAIESTGGGNISLTNTSGAILSGTKNFDVYSGSGTVTVKAYQDIGTVANPLTIHGSGFTLGNEGGGVFQNLIAVALTRNGNSTVQTSDTSFDTGNQLGDNIYVAAGMGTSTLEINDNAFILGNVINRTLSNTGGNIRVTQANALFSGTGTMTLDASSTTFEKLTTIAAGHTVKASTGNTTVVSGLGGLSGAGTLSNTGTVLLVDGTMAPGAGGIGTLTISGGVTMGSTGIFDAELGTNATNGDRLVVGQNFVAGGTLNVAETNLSSTVAGTNYTVATVGGTASGTFANTNSSAASFSSSSGVGVVTVNASSLTNKWINSSSGTWSVGSNWSRGIAPTTGHDAWIDVASFNPTVTVIAGAVANSLHVGDTLTLNSSLAITGGMTVLNGGTWNHNVGGGSTITAGANITIDAGGVMNWSGGVIGSSADTSSKLFVNNGTVNISGPGSSFQDIYRNWNNNGLVNWTGGRFTELVANASGEITFTNTATGQINLNSTFTGTDSFISGGLGSIINQGTITSASSNAATITRLNGTQNAMQNTGKIFANVGTLSVGTSGSLSPDTGGYTIASGAALEFAASRFLNAGASLEGSGSLRIASGAPLTVGSGVGVGVLTAGSVNLAGQLNLNTGNTQTLNTLSISSAGVLFSGDAVSMGSLTAAGGTFSGTGIFSTTGASAITGNLIRIGGAWNNSGVMSVSATGSLQLSGSSTLSNTPGGQINYVGAGTDAVFVGTGTNRFINQGTISLGAGTTARALNVAFDNIGVVNINAGQLTFGNTTTGTESGTYNVASGASLLINGTRNFTSLAPGAGLFGTGLLDVQSGGVVTLSSGVGTGLLQNGTLKVASGRLTLSTGSGFTFANTVQLLGSSTLSHANAMTGAFTANGTGLITSPAAGTVWTLPTLTTSTLSLGSGTFSTTNSILENFGTLNFTGNGTLSIGNSFTNQGIVNLTGDGTLIGSATFNNTSAGTVNRSTSANTFNIVSGFAQGGTINANSGTLAFANAFTNSRLIQGTGRINVGGTGLTNGSAGTIAPGGVGAVGTLTIGGSLTMASGSKLLIDAISAATYDKLNVTGDVNSVAGAVISVSEATPFLVVNDQLDALAYAGTFSGALPTVAAPVGVTLNGNTTASSNGFLRLTASAISNFWKESYVDTNYANVANWSRGHLPTLTEDAVINPTLTAGVNVTLSSGTQTPRSLQLTGDDFLSINSSTFTVGQNSTVASAAGLFINNGVLNGAGDLNIAGGLNLNNATLAGSGTLGTSSAATTTITSASTVSRNWTNSGTITMTGGSSYLTMNDNLSNQASGLINMNSTYDGSVITMNTSSTAFNNAGTINWNSGSTPSSSVIGGSALTSFNNSGQFNITGNSNVSIALGGSDSGDYSVPAGSKLNFTSGTRSLTTGSDITGAGSFANNNATTTINDQFSIGNTGTISVLGGSLTLASSVAAPIFSKALNLTGGTFTLNTADVVFNVPVSLSSATLNGSADFDFSTGSSLTLNNGTIGGSGTLGTASGISSNITSASTVSRNWTNVGTINMTGASSYLTMNGNLSNQASGVINMNSTYDGSVITMNTSSTAFNNAGTINWNSGSSPSSSVIGGSALTSFNNSGQFNITGNSNVSIALGGSDSGDYSVPAGSKLNFTSGTRSLTTGSDITGAGSFANNNATTTINDQFSIGNTGTISVLGGSLNLASTLAAPDFSNPLTISGGSTLSLNMANVVFDVPVSLSNSTLNGNANFDFVTGSNLSLTSGTISGSGSGTFGTASGVSTNITSASTVSRNWTNAGTITMSGTSYLAMNGNWSNLASGVINMNSAYNGVAINLNATGTALNNAGTINWNSGVASPSSDLAGTTGTSFNNSGTFNVLGNSYTELFIPTFSQTGTVDVASGSTLKRTVGIANAGLLRGGGTLNVGSNTLTSSGGTIAPGGIGSVGTLTVQGNANLTGAKVLFDVDTAALYDRLAVTGNLTLGSAPLVLSELSGNYTVGDNFSLITYGGNVSGSAPTLNTTAIADVTFTASTSAASGGSVISSVDSVINRWLDVDGLWQTGSNWSRGHTPTLLEDVVIDVAGTRSVLLNIGTGKARSFTISGDETLSVVDGSTLQLGSGNSTIGVGATLQIDNSFIQGGTGSSILNQGTLSGSGTIILSNGSGTLTNLGTLAPGEFGTGNNFGTLTISGNLILGDLSQAFFDLSVPDSDRISVSGNVNYAGSNGPTLTINESGGATFLGGEIRTLISSGTGFVAGAGQNKNPSDVEFKPTVVGNDMQVEVIGVKNTWLTATPSGASWFTNSNWSRGITPNQYHDVFITQGSANLVTITSGAANARSVTLGDGFNANLLALTGGGASLTVNNLASTTSTLVDVLQGSALGVSGGASLLLGAGTMYVGPGALLQLNSGTVAAFGGSQGTAYLENQGLILSNGPSVLGQSANGKDLILDNQNGAGLGTIEVASGELQIQSNSFYQNGLIKISSNTSTLSYLPGTLFNDGTIEMAGGTLNLGTNSLSNSETIKGTGTIDAASVFSEGVIEVGTSPTAAGVLTILGDYSQDTSGILKVRAFGTNSSDALAVTGTASIAGTLQISSGNSYSPSVGDVYIPVQSTNTVGGNFDTVNVANLPYGASQTTNPGGLQVTLSFAGNVWTGAGGDGEWDNPLNWSLNHVPTTGEKVVIDPSGAQVITLDIAAANGLGEIYLSGSGNDDTLRIITGGSLTANGGDTLSGTLQIQGGSFTNAGANTGAKNISMSSGQLNVNADMSISTLNVSGGVMTVASGNTLSLINQASISASVLGAGTITNLGGGHTYLSNTISIAPRFNNQGFMQLNDEISFSDLRLESYSVLYLSGATLNHTSGNLTNEANAYVQGHGTINVGSNQFINQGYIQPYDFTSPATISIAGNADLTAGYVELDLMGVGSYDRLNVMGVATLGSGSNIQLIENTPFIGSGDSFPQLISAASFTGSSAPSLTLVDSSYNTITEVSMSLSKTSNSLDANVNSVTNNWALSTGGQWNKASNWSRGHAPRLGENVVIDPVGSQVVTLSGGSGSAQNISMPGSNGADSLRIEGTDLVISNSLVTAGYLLMEGSVTPATIAAANNITVANLNVNGAATVQAGQTLTTQGGLFTGSGATITIDAQRWENTSGTLTMNLSSGTVDLLNTDFVNANASTLDLNGSGTGIAFNGSGIFTNDGTLINSAGNNKIALELDNTINGSISVNAGSLTASSATGFGNNGVVELAANTSFLTGNTAFNNNGLVSGLGTINVGSGLFSNSSTGFIAPGGAGGAGVGQLTIAGAANLSAGELDIGLQSISSYDKLHVTGALTTGAGFNIDVSETAGTFVAGGNTFNVLSYGSTASGIPTVNSSIAGKTFTVSQASAFGSSFTITASGGVVTNIFWDSGGDGVSWADPLNWSTDLLPIAGQNVTVDSLSNTVTISAGTNISGLIGFNLDGTDALFITGGSLALPGSNLNLNGTVNLAGGTLVGNSAGGSFAGGLNWSAGKFGGTGTYSSSSLSLAGGGIRTLDGATLVSSSASGSTLNNGSLLLNSGQYSTGALGFLVTGAGTLAFAGGAISSSGVTNDGVLRVDSGNVALNNTAVQTGAFSIASGSNLSFQNNVSLGSGASIVGGSWTIDNGKTVITSGALNRGAGGVTFINGALQIGGDFETEQLIFLSGGSITGGTKALRVTQQWDDSAIGAGSVSGLGSATINQAAGNLQFNKLLAVTGNMLLSASTGSITGGTNAVSAGQRLQANASGLVDLNVQAATLAASSTGGNIVLDVTGPTLINALSTSAGKTATINTTGNVGQNGIINTAGHIELNLGGYGVSWLNSGNVFGDGVRVNSGNLVQLISNAASPMSISGSIASLQAGGGAVQLGDSFGTLNVSGPLTVVASGNITQGAALNITGLTDLTGSSIMLGTASSYGGGVQFAATGPVLLNATGALAVRGSTPGSLSLTATGNITQSGTLNIGGAASLTATGKNIILNNPANNFLSVQAVADQINLTDADTNNNGLAISGTLGTIASYLVGGNLTSNGLLTSPQLNVNNSVAGNSVNLGSLNVNSLVSFNTSAGAYTDISYNNAGIAQLGSPIVATGNVSIATAGALTLPSVSASSFTVGATGGDITQQAGSTLRAPVASFSVASGKDILLTETANELQSFTASGRNVGVVSTKTLDPNIASTGNVVINAVGINQTAGHAVLANSFTANVSGGLGLFGSGNQLGSVSGSANADIQINDSGSSLVLNGLQAGGSNGINISSTGSLIQGAGQLNASKVSLSGTAIGASGAGVIQLDTSSGVRFNATSGDAYVRNNNSNKHELANASATGTLHYETTTGNGYQVTGDVSATNVELLSGGAMQIGGAGTAVLVNGSNSVSLSGLSITVGDTKAAASSAVLSSNGSVTINAGGGLSILGGNQNDAYASVDAAGPVTVNVPVGGVTITGGTGAGAYARLDPTGSSSLSITSVGAINLQGGTGAGAYAAIVSNGNITLNAPSLSMVAGSGLDADAVVISNFGRITAPSNCNGCVNLNISPLGNGMSNTGLYEGASTIGQSNNTSLLSTQLTQIDTVLRDAQRDPEDRRDPEPEISVEGQNCP